MQPPAPNAPHLAALLPDAAEVQGPLAVKRLVEGARDHGPVALAQALDQPGE